VPATPALQELLPLAVYFDRRSIVIGLRPQTPMLWSAAPGKRGLVPAQHFRARFMANSMSDPAHKRRLGRNSAKSAPNPTSHPRWDAPKPENGAAEHMAALVIVDGARAAFLLL